MREITLLHHELSLHEAVLQFAQLNYPEQVQTKEQSAFAGDTSKCNKMHSKNVSSCE